MCLKNNLSWKTDDSNHVCLIVRAAWNVSICNNSTLHHRDTLLSIKTFYSCTSNKLSPTPAQLCQPSLLWQKIQASQSNNILFMTLFVVYVQHINRIWHFFQAASSQNINNNITLNATWKNMTPYICIGVSQAHGFHSPKNQNKMKQLNLLPTHH